MVRRSLTWLVLGLVIMVCAWGATTSLAGILFLDRAFSGFLADAARNASWALVLAPSIGVVYAVPLLLWPRVLRRIPPAERDLLHLAIGAAVLALPGALMVGSAYAPSPPFFLAFTCAFATGWLALFLPRAVVPSLAPGAFQPAATEPLSLDISRR